MAKPTWTAKHAIRCPFCGRRFEASWRSQVSREDAENRAEELVYQILNNHIVVNHPRGI